ncbi:MAG: response regulator transcription factor [Chloroflexi bacterium]|nr:response regulator transcription factor [Chloroflexota bacterium]
MLTAQRSTARYSQHRPDSSTVPAPSGCSIYVVDDDPVIANLVFHNLRSSGYQVAQFANGSEMLDTIESKGRGEAEWPDLVVLDIMMPGPNGLEVARSLREFSQIPILILSIRDETDTKLAALDLGVDDYLTKPFEVSELLARVRAILRRTLPPTEDVPLTRYRRGDLWIDLQSTRVTLGNKAVRLTEREWAVLKVLVEHAGQVVAPRQVLQQAWGPEYGDEGDYIRTYITRLRRKLEPDPSRPVYILLERGMGYRLAEPG